MTLTLRSASTSVATTKGAALTHAEMDANWLHALQSSNQSFLQSGSAASLTVQEKLRQTKAMVDFITDNTIRAAVIAGTNVADLTTYVQAALDSGYNLDLQGYTFYANNLTDDDASKNLVSTAGIGKIIKNANGALFTASGANYTCINVSFRGDAASPTYTGDGAVFTGAHPILINCGARWFSGRALKCTGSHAQVYGTCDIYQTADATATGYDVEIGVSGTLTTYHELHGIYSSQTTGGILFTDTGSHTIVGGEFGKLKIDSGTSPAGVNGGKTIGARILGAVSVELSGAVFSSNQFGDIAFTLESGTSGCRVDASNTWGSSATVTNSGNANNLIVREVSAGSTTQLKFGDDTAAAILTINQASGEFETPSFRIQNNKNFTLEQASAASGATIGMSSGDTLGITNTVTGEAIQIAVTGTTSGSVIQQIVGGSSKSQVGAGGFHRINSVSADKGDAAATLSPSSSEPTNVWATPLTVDRAVTLSTTNALNGMKFRVIRKASATGAFNLNVGTGPLKALGIGAWCDVEYDGSAWFLAAYGTL